MMKFQEVKTKESKNNKLKQQRIESSKFDCQYNSGTPAQSHHRTSDLILNNSSTNRFENFFSGRDLNIDYNGVANYINKNCNFGT